MTIVSSDPELDRVRPRDVRRRREEIEIAAVGVLKGLRRKVAGRVPVIADARDRAPVFA